MGNVLSEEDQEERFLEDGFNLESPDADKVINYGTAAPVWQNKKSSSSRSLENNDASHQTNRNENNNESNHRNHSTNNSSSDVGQEVVVAAPTITTNSEPSRRRTTNESSTTQEDTPPDSDETPKKLSYIQMAKLGYQELINAIIRPPRADYKVRAKNILESESEKKGICACSMLYAK